MHIPYAVLEPGVAIATTALGALGLGCALRAVRGELGERTTPLMGMMSAFVFAAQMVNFPVGAGVSGHLLGGVLASVVLGPWGGSVVIGAVLIVQCFLFGDGGLDALGANFLNMGMLGAVCGHAIYAPIRRAIGGRRGILIGSMVAAWFSVLLAAGACAVELSAGQPPREFLRILSWMALIHTAIGVGEAVITGLVVRFILLTRPDLLEAGRRAGGSGEFPEVPGRVRPRPGWISTAVAGLGIAMAVAVFVSPMASELPDGLEFVGDKTGILAAGREAAWPALPVPMPDYKLDIPGSGPLEAATALAGLAGTLVVFGMSWSLARIFAGGEKAPERLGADVA
ncbi:Fused nickel transport protein NikMN [Aquisphaera giovannonii]|uniref:Fused nickel transport protein NikMN n=1 Tax=Aquisphaera giovannonii TaxID=406548 RepID=A0A5B9VZS0_9BACT|nr:energy-coupling factor ABC transporter permease [Aquisphaera giovannonii]QEH33489.1 Fused nickel transport protein NikMN [Aquisphaera giovannonii]